MKLNLCVMKNYLFDIRTIYMDLSRTTRVIKERTRQLQLTQKIKLKINNRYLTRTIPPWAIFDIQCLYPAKSKIVFSKLRNVNDQLSGRTPMCVAYANFYTTGFRIIRHLHITWLANSRSREDFVSNKKSTTHHTEKKLLLFYVMLRLSLIFS